MPTTTTQKFEIGNVYNFDNKNNANESIRVEIRKDNSVNVLKRNKSNDTISHSYTGKLLNSGSVEFMTKKRTRKTTHQLGLSPDNTLQYNTLPWVRTQSDQWHLETKAPLVDNTFENSKENIKEMTSNITGLIAGLQNLLKAIFEPIVSMFKNMFNGMKQEISKGVFKEACDSVKENTGSFATNVWNTAKSSVNGIAAGVSNTFTGICDSITKTAKDESEKLTRRATDKTNEFVKAVEEANMRTAEEVTIASGGLPYSDKQIVSMQGFVSHYNELNQSLNPLDTNTLITALREGDGNKRSSQQNTLRDNYIEWSNETDPENAVIPAKTGNFISNTINSLFIQPVSNFFAQSGTKVVQNVVENVRANALKSATTAATASTQNHTTAHAPQANMQLGR